MIEGIGRRQAIGQCLAVANARQGDMGFDPQILERRRQEKRLVLAIAVTAGDNLVGLARDVGAPADFEADIADLVLHQPQDLAHALLGRGMTRRHVVNLLAEGRRQRHARIIVGCHFRGQD